MSLLSLLFAVLIVGVLAYVINALPMPQPFKVAAFGILLIIGIIWVAQALGVALPGIH